MAAETGLKIHVRIPTFQPENKDVEAAEGSNPPKDGEGKASSRRYSVLRKRNPKSLPFAEEPSPHRLAAAHDIIRGSFAHTSTTPRGSLSSRELRASPISSPRASSSHVQLEHLLQAVDADLDGYGLEESRDGFFDASFHRPLKRNREDLMRKAAETLPDAFRKKNHPLSLRRFLPQQLREAKAFFQRVSTSRAGIRLLKTFLGFFITFVICLIPASRNWLGKYNYIMVVSAIVNHPGRAIGSQVDGAILTIFGTVAGLGWGSLALYVSTSTATAQSGYGGILATFLVIFALLIGWLRCVFIRLFQAVLCAGIAIVYTCLANTSQSVGWKKVFDYGIPWVLGQAVCLVIAALVFPDAGSRSLALALHGSLNTIQAGLVLPSPEMPFLKRKLAWQFVNVSQAVRDFTLEFTVSRFLADDVVLIRNLIQGVIRSILAITPDPTLFADLDPLPEPDSGQKTESVPQSPELHHERAKRTICETLKEPARILIDAMVASIVRADKTILSIGGQGAAQNGSHLLSQALDNLRNAKETFDSADALLVAHPHLSSEYAKSPDVIQLFLFVHPVRQTADKVEALVAKVLEMEQAKRKWRIRAPSYPFNKAIMRTNAQVRHDRGGLTAGFYFRSKRQLDRTMAELQSSAYIPAARHAAGGQHMKDAPDQSQVIGEYQKEQEFDHGQNSAKAPFRYRVWEVMHRLQGFEARFAFKVTLVTTLLSVPALLPQSRGWWNDDEAWWAVVTVWAMMHPRVGGTFQDLAVRTFCAAIGAIWAGLAYAAGNGNPYVMAVFTAVYMIPMLYRFTQSSHPRSGVVGCLSFTVVSLSACTEGGYPSIITIAWTRGLAFVVGLVAALTVNWILWPFVARHELRKSLSSMMLHSAILYRGVIAKYIYYIKGEEPGPKDIARSEMLEGRLREGFVRMRQLMELTRHEMRLRAPFNPLPYSALITACESFFEHLVQVRQSSLYFQPNMLASHPDAMAALTVPRRDAVAVILMNLYVLACALRADQPVPRYLPSAAMARRRLLDCMEIVEADQARRMEVDAKGKGIEKGGNETGHEEGKGRRWADVYQYAFSGALTDVVENLQEMQRYTKEVCGEVEWESDGLVQ
ncbi:MAG: hypothetical protein ALECFALPRED_009579 [Alectoria fallacina]|uniref:ER transporter 6TM N-terminal domain-containing protein n=1 Tax=Alectoria fallacina TaxID=1903189 RepID=A0A8H3EVQ9_9LECA|nr:MAG: hypothetical protein ALECFALPRED_009579 [Alectoria fallacina]